VSTKEALMRTLAVSLSFFALTTALASSGGAAIRGTVSLTGTVGPGFTITLKNHGKTVKTLAPAKFTFVIHDNSSIHDFHLTGPGVNKKTSVGGMGTTHWTLTLRKGTYRFVCDPHKTTMKGSFVVKAP
jgi:plastocyanin